MKKLTLSPCLESIKEDILKTKKEMIKILTKKEKTTVLDSKLGGVPYWPKDSDIIEINNQQVALMAQINFTELTKQNIVLKDFPNEGILQFYFVAGDDMWGLTFDERPSQIKVIYHQTIEEHQEFTKEEIKSYLDCEVTPFMSPLKLTFEKEEDYVGMSDEYYYTKLINKELDDEQTDAMYDDINNAGSKLSGYAYFTQSDPRDSNKNIDWVLLLQLDSDDNMMFGDCGVANWFISKEDLINKNFNNILFNWDCC